VTPDLPARAVFRRREKKTDRYRSSCTAARHSRWSDEFLLGSSTKQKGRHARRAPAREDMLKNAQIGRFRAELRDKPTAVLDENVCDHCESDKYVRSEDTRWRAVTSVSLVRHDIYVLNTYLTNFFVTVSVAGLPW